MPTSTPTNLTDRLQRLLEERQQHGDALARIDSTLEQIRFALQAVGGANGKRGPTRSHAALAKRSAAPRRRRGSRGTFATSATQMILSLAGQRGGATTQEIKAKWKSEGRGGTADNALSKMVRDGKLQRTPLDGQRGSRFTVA